VPKAVGVALVGLLLPVLAVAGFTLLGFQPHEQPEHEQFCFAEWCIAPTALTHAGSISVVRVQVRSDARSSTQRPDHPQAWLVDPQGRMVGGPVTELSGPVGPQAGYAADLSFAVATTRCSTFVVSEGAWPSFLGLGYTPSPFTERASWHLCA
jgi:hypothetical protein